MPRPKKANKAPRAPRRHYPKVTLALDAEVEALLHQAMADSGVQSKSRMVRYCVAAALGHPLQKQAIFEVEQWFRQVSLLVLRKFAGRFSAELPEIVEQVLYNEEGELAEEDALTEGDEDES